MTMPIDLGTESLPEPVASRDTAISCLVRLGARNGVNLQIETVRRRAALDGDTITASRLIKLADECGLQAEWTRLDWQGLKTRGFSQLLIFREDTNAVVLTGGARAGAEEVSIWDPHHDGVIFYVGREDFERAWSGHALMITPKEPSKAPTSPSQQSAAIVSKIRGKPANIVKSESSANPVLGAGSSSSGRHSRPSRHWWRSLLNFAPIGTVVSVSITIFLLIHPGWDKAVGISTPAGEDAAGAAQDTPSTGGMAALPSATGVAVSTSTEAARIIAAPVPTEPQGGSSPNAAKTWVVQEPQVTSTPVTSEQAPRATGGALFSAPEAGASYAEANPSDAAPASSISDRPALSATTAPAAPSSANELSAATSAPPATGLTETHLSTADTAAFLTRADMFFSKGDIAAARLFYERAADAGDGQAALRLGETFDPVFLDLARLRGVRSDLSAALFWYRRARDLGIAEAGLLLKSLGAK
jgi:peptidase C39-like protein